MYAVAHGCPEAKWQVWGLILGHSYSEACVLSVMLPDPVGPSPGGTLGSPGEL